MSLRVNDIAPEFERRRAKVLSVSVGSAEEHRKWKRDIAAFAGCPADAATADDTALGVTKLYNMLPADACRTDRRTAARSATLRTVCTSSGPTGRCG